MGASSDPTPTTRAIRAAGTPTYIRCLTIVGQARPLHRSHRLVSNYRLIFGAF